MRDFHLPLPMEIYHDLCKEADRSNRPATAVARQAIKIWRKECKKTARHTAVATFAAEHTGGPLDFDVNLEAASVKHPLEEKP